MEEISPIKRRIFHYVDFKGISKTSFFKLTGLNYGNFKGKSLKSDLTSGYIAEILSCYPDINAKWLLTGEGAMLKRDDVRPVIASHVRGNETIDNATLIPLVSLSAVAGFGNNEFAIDKSDVKEYYVVPKFKDRRIDFMIEVSGSSMYPKYSSGDVVACTILRESQFIQWNKVHVIGTVEQGILIKRIKKGPDDGHLLLISDNKDYDPFVINRSEVTGIALVAGVIRLE